MTAKEYLSQAYRIDQRINSKLEQIVSLREITTKATSTLSDMPKNATPNPHSMENIIGKIIDLENEINDDINALVNIKKEVVTTVKKVENPEYQTLLELRYLCFKSWEQITIEMGYDLRWIYRLHQRALAEVKTYTTLTPRFGILNGYLFIYSGTTNVIRKYNASTGAYIEDYTVPSGSVQRIQQFNNQFIMFWYNANPIYAALYDGVNLYKWYVFNHSLSYQMDCICALYPEKSGILMGFISNIGAARLGANLFAPILFTVNNLATPVVKTSSQTMKVTYTITW